MTIAVEVLEPFAAEAATRLAPELSGAASIILTGGTTAADVYSLLPRRCFRPGASVFFSDERCVPPDHESSNYAMATAKLSLEGDDRIVVHRMRGEDDPRHAAAGYHDAIAPLAGPGIDVALLGLGADCHIAALFPGSPVLDESSERLCAAVDRPDGLGGLTLTPPALAMANRVFVVVAGTSKREAVERLLRGDETLQDCPARLLDELPDVILVGDRACIGSV
ncbi:MAG: 6-phosphogluconolactonase [Actinomycetota bacterium]|nr:6-phosphogluconolactonase [Actinomycetota bacterium]